MGVATKQGREELGWGRPQGQACHASVFWRDSRTRKGGHSIPSHRERGTGPRIWRQIPYLLCDFEPGWASVSWSVQWWCDQRDVMSFWM